MTSPLLLPVLVAVATLCAAVFAAGLLWYRSPETPNERQQVEGKANLVGLVVVVAGVLLFGLGDAVVRAVPGPTLPSLDRTFLGVLVGLAAATTVLVGPAVTKRTLLDDDPLGEVLVDVAKEGAPLLVLAPLGVLALIAGAKSPFPPVVVIVPSVVALAYVAASGVISASHRTRLPLSEAPTDAVERALDRTGFDADRVLVFDADRADLWRPFSEGIGRFGRVFVPLSSFEAYDDDVLETLVVMVTQPSPFEYYRILTCWGAVGVALALALGGEAVSTTALGVGFLALLVFVPAAVWGGRRLAFRHDASVASILGADRVVEALVAQDERRDGDAPSTLALLFLMRPSITERVERLGGDPTRLPSTSRDDDPASASGPEPAAQSGPRQAPSGGQRAPQQPPQQPRGQQPTHRNPPSSGRSPKDGAPRPQQGPRGSRQRDRRDQPRGDPLRRDSRDDGRPAGRRPTEESEDRRPPGGGRRDARSPGPSRGEHDDGRRRGSHPDETERRDRTDTRRGGDAQW